MTSRRFLLGLMTVGVLAFVSAKEARSATLTVSPLSHERFEICAQDDASFIHCTLNGQYVLLGPAQTLFYDSDSVPSLKLGSSVYLRTEQFTLTDPDLDIYDHVWWGKWFEVTSRQRFPDGTITAGIQQYGPTDGGGETIVVWSFEIWDLIWWEHNY